MSLLERLKHGVEKMIHPSKSKEAEQMAEKADPKFKEIIDAYQSAKTPEDQEAQRERARNVFYATAEHVKDYDKKIELLGRFWGQEPFVDGLVNTGRSAIDETPWSYEQFRERLAVWDKTAGTVEGFDYGPGTFTDKFGQKKELSFVSPDEAAVVENHDNQMLQYLQEKAGDRYQEAVNVLNLLRRAKVDYFEPRVQDGYRDNNSAAHAEPIVRNLVTKLGPESQWQPTNLVDTTAYLISTFEGKEKQELVNRFKSDVMDKIVGMSAIKDPKALRTAAEQFLNQAREVYEDAYRKAMAYAKGGEKNIHTTPEYRNARHETHMVDSVLLVKNGRLKPKNELPVVEFSAPRAVKGWPQEQAAPEPAKTEQPVVKPEPIKEQPQPVNKAAEAYRRFRSRDMVTEPRPIEKFDDKVEWPDVRLMNYHLMPQLPDNVESKPFMAMMLRLARYNRAFTLTPSIHGYSRERPHRTVLGSEGIINTTISKLLKRIEAETSGVSEKERQAMYSLLLQPMLELYAHTDMADIPLEDSASARNAAFEAMMKKPADQKFAAPFIDNEIKFIRGRHGEVIDAADKILRWPEHHKPAELKKAEESKARHQKLMEEEIAAVYQKYETQEGLFLHAADEIGYLYDNFEGMSREAKTNASSYAWHESDRKKRIPERYLLRLSEHRED